jgi:hypothetical protein
VQIARVRFGKSLEFDQQFIPPCVTMNSHDRLWETAKGLIQAAENLAETCRSHRIGIAKQSEKVKGRDSVESKEFARQIENCWLWTGNTVKNPISSPLQFFTALLDFYGFIVRDAKEVMGIPSDGLPKRLEDLRSELGSGSQLSKISDEAKSILGKISELLQPVLGLKVVWAREIEIRTAVCKFLTLGEWEYSITLNRTLGEELKDLNLSQVKIGLELKEEPISTSVRIFRNESLLKIPAYRELRMESVHGHKNNYEFTFEPDSVELEQKTITFYTRSEPADRQAVRVMILGA